MKKILVANRGEIAIRVMQTAKKMGIKTVAVYSVADRNAPHVKFADEAVCIGEAPSSQSYLRGDKIIEVCKQLGVDGIHPGYGFLSENADFADLVEKNNITFIGPKSKAMHMMGNKLAAKDAVKDYDIPMVPGVDEAITDIPKAKKIAVEIGFPILIKAAAGGGGKGMRVVNNEGEFESQMDRAVSEAVSAFGDGSVFIEKYVGSPRHIEIQVMADSHGNIIYLFERECSVQRRHQKVVEEAPSSVLTPEIRKAMGEAAVKVAKACDYLGAGTVEFLLDENKNFYFLEMNTRLQVEHPVTELIAGVDLVEMQIRVARGEALTIKQEDLQITGHAMELRVYAEDPLNDFLPSVGNLEVYQLPVGEGIRVDNGFEQGMDVPIYYDPMLAKLITYGKTREESIELMIKAIADYKVEGISTTLPFGTFVMEHEAFRSGDFDTHFVKKYYDAEVLKAQAAKEAEIAALVALKKYLEDQKVLRLPIN
ncbi:acetyl-CoA carboxylase biotin carboxylase subunit [Flavobacterium sp.]|jgi:propionyl-CoA carboxylase alpha chain|uniref:acetyl-CoA carboxylase biotin carboxylase subunit n=1 Tax=Flavobacterium sp. TaxID=239 RepID=UPI002A7ED321|nr:acetyl-CoA carboxylase biotin carboxylase subunit [Flavobacterium sp.]